MKLNLEGKTALITGGSRGIGRAIAQELASAGCNLVLTSRNAADLAKAKAEIESKSGIKARTVAADLAMSTTVAQLAKDFAETDILVNNAGAIPGGTLNDVDEARWRSAWDLKVFGTINMTRAFYPAMKNRGGGVIINVIGNAARTRDPDYICGATANAGLTAFTESLGSRSLRDGIRIVGVSPGPTSTDRLVGLVEKRALEKFGDAARWPELFSGIPGGR